MWRLLWSSTCSKYPLLGNNFEINLYVEKMHAWYKIYDDYSDVTSQLWSLSVSPARMLHLHHSYMCIFLGWVLEQFGLTLVLWGTVWLSSHTLVLGQAKGWNSVGSTISSENNQLLNLSPHPPPPSLLHIFSLG